MSHVMKFIEMYKEGKLSESTIIKMAAFKEELEAEIEKTADPSVGAFLQYLAAGLALSLGLGGAAAGAQVLYDKYKQNKLDDTKEPLFKDMLRLHPELVEKKERAKLYFDALWHFSPIIAQNPMAAGAYIRQALSMDTVAGGPLPQMVKELSDIQKSHVEARKNAPSAPGSHIIEGLLASPTKLMPSFPNYGSFND